MVLCLAILKHNLHSALLDWRGVGFLSVAYVIKIFLLVFAGKLTVCDL